MDTYEFLFEGQCFCPPDYTAPVLVMVNQGAITKVIDVKSGQSISVNKYKNYSTIDKLFEFIQFAIDEEVVQIDVNYPPKYGWVFQQKHG